MRDESAKKTKLSWSKTLVKKWFNIKSKTENFHPDDVASRGDSSKWKDNFSENVSCTIKKSKTEVPVKRRNFGGAHRGKIDLESAQVAYVQNYRMFVATWNVGGKSPPSHMKLDDWLHSSPPADIYVLGFQEIVPLNAGNVLGSEDNGPARKWLALIRNSLNNLPSTNEGSDHHTPPISGPIIELDADFEGSTRKEPSSFFYRRSFHSLSRSTRIDNGRNVAEPRLDRRFSDCDQIVFNNRPNDFDPNFSCVSNNENGYWDLPSVNYFHPMSYAQENSDHSSRHSRFCPVISKQMVGIFLTIWVRSDIRKDIKNLKASCVGRGLMGFLGNKGSISISMYLDQTSFCFICSHLTSGQKEGDEFRRNSDVMEILRKTRFPRIHGLDDDNSPETIFEHQRIIWLGDLNYRIALSYHSAKALVEMRNWRALLEKDQLRIEQKLGRVFEGWNEGKIYFPPTYKYSNNSDRYSWDNMHSKEKCRTPAWCDRILWYGNGLNQLSYVRWESKFSDHRPVYSIFAVEVETINRTRLMRSTYTTIEAEEFFTHSHGDTELNFFLE